MTHAVLPHGTTAFRGRQAWSGLFGAGDIFRYCTPSSLLPGPSHPGESFCCRGPPPAPPSAPVISPAGTCTFPCWKRWSPERTESGLSPRGGTSRDRVSSRLVAGRQGTLPVVQPVCREPTAVHAHHGSLWSSRVPSLSLDLPTLFSLWESYPSPWSSS